MNNEEVNKLFEQESEGNEDIVINTLLNGDGTLFNPPENPLRDKWEKKYTPTRNGEPCDGPVLGYMDNGSPIMNYTCVNCAEKTCIHSDYWEVPEEDKEEYEKYLKEYNAYMEEHSNLSAETMEYLLKTLHEQEEYMQEEIESEVV